MYANKHILVADDERPLCRLLTNELERHGYTVVSAHTGEQALQKFAQTPFAVVVLDIMFETGGIDGLTVLKEIRTQRPETQVIMLTAYASLESAVEALRLGVWDYVRKGPQVLDDITFSVTKAFEAIRSPQGDCLLELAGDLKVGRRPIPAASAKRHTVILCYIVEAHRTMC